MGNDDIFLVETYKNTFVELESPRPKFDVRTRSRSDPNKLFC